MLDEVNFEAQVLSDIRSENKIVRNKALRLLYKKFYPMILSFIKQNSGGAKDAEDVFQDSMIVLYRSIRSDKFRGESALSTYLFAIARNIWLRKLQKTQHFVNAEDAQFESLPDKLVKGDDKITTLIQQMITQIGGHCKEILTQYYFDNCSLKEISNNLGYKNERSVRSRKYNCLQRIIEFLQANPSLKKALKEYV